MDTHVDLLNKVSDIKEADINELDANDPFCIRIKQDCMWSINGIIRMLVVLARDDD